MRRIVINAIQDEDRQHDPVQRQEEALEEDQAEAVDPWLVLLLCKGFASRELCHLSSL